MAGRASVEELLSEARSELIRLSPQEALDATQQGAGLPVEQDR